MRTALTFQGSRKWGDSKSNPHYRVGEKNLKKKAIRIRGGR